MTHEKRSTAEIQKELRRRARAVRAKYGSPIEARPEDESPKMESPRGDALRKEQTMTPPDLIERVAKAIAQELFGGFNPRERELGAMLDRAAIAALTAGDAWLTDPTSTKPEGVTRQALNSIDDQKLYREGN